MGKIVFCVMSAAALCGAMLVSGGCLDRQTTGKTPAPGESSTKTTPAGGKSVGSVLRDLGSAPASAQVAEFVKPYRMIGPIIVVAGIAAFFLGGAATGWSMIAMGAAATFIGASVMQYPWLALILVVVLGAWMVGLVRRGKKTEGGLSELVQVIQEAPHKKEITAALNAKGIKVTSKVRAVVDPIKQALGLTKVGEGKEEGAAAGEKAAA